MMDRRYLSQTKREAIVLRQDNRCSMCGNPLIAGHFEFDHIQALEHDGDNADDNWRAICTSPCHKLKTKADHQARGRRDRLAIGGRARKSPPMAGSRGSKFKRKMNGEVVYRDA